MASSGNPYLVLLLDWNLYNTKFIVFTQSLICIRGTEHREPANQQLSKVDCWFDKNSKISVVKVLSNRKMSSGLHKELCFLCIVLTCSKLKFFVLSYSRLGRFVLQLTNSCFKCGPRWWPFSHIHFRGAFCCKHIRFLFSLPWSLSF